MSRQLMTLAQRRKKLVQKISAQRTEMSALGRQWEKPLSIADSALKVIAVMRSHPSWVASGFAALLAWRLNENDASPKPRWRLAAPSSIVAGYRNLSTRIRSHLKR
jgi:hypothetical protein